MTQEELRNIRAQYLAKNYPYQLLYWKNFYYPVLKNVMTYRRSGRGFNTSYNDIIIMADTETSKQHKNSVSEDNHVVAWTISLRVFNHNLVTLYGHKPSSMVACIERLLKYMQGDDTFIYFHNLAYDWQFLRKFMIKKWAVPMKQLNTKSHYPIMIQFSNGVIFKDSLILAQRSLDKWAKDLNVSHQKAIGKWDYDKIRNQEEVFTSDELEYIEHDTLAGVECINALKDTLNKHLFAMPYTATGIPREEVRKIFKANRGRDTFKRIAPTYEQQNKLELVYHGGYTHANRHLIDVKIDWLETSCRDFSSSYPFTMLSEKYPSEKFFPLDDKDIHDIIANADEYAYMFKLILIRPRLKDDFIEMPALQFSKCVSSINAINDNGRVLCADYIEIYITEQDAIVINEQYTWEKHICTEVEASHKKYLPRFFTDYIYKLYQDKTLLKGGDAVLYSIAKAKLNSL